jgi:hypothetical protein
LEKFYPEPIQKRSVDVLWGMNDNTHLTSRSAIVQHLFALAAERSGGPSALVRQLGLTYSELKTYLAGEAVPPHDVLFRAMDLVIEDLKPANSQNP